MSAPTVRILCKLDEMKECISLVSVLDVEDSRFMLLVILFLLMPAALQGKKYRVHPFDIKSNNLPSVRSIPQRGHLSLIVHLKFAIL